MKGNKSMRVLLYGAMGLALILAACGSQGGGDNIAVTGAGGIGPEQASTDSAFPISATVGIDTGLRLVAKTNTAFAPSDPAIHWGDGTTSPALLDCVRVPLEGVYCDFLGQKTYSRTGTFPVNISYDSTTLNTSARVSPVSDFVIVTTGDSVASGEGNPVRNLNVNLLLGHRAYWDDEDCHRSSISGPAMAARAIPGATFLPLACSGARISGFIGQLRDARKNYGLSRIDVLLVSVGANNVDTRSGGQGFGPNITYCAKPLICSNDDTFREDMASSMHFLNTVGYSDANQEITCASDSSADACAAMPSPVPKHVLITEYFDPTHDDSGEIPGFARNQTCTENLITHDEWQFLFDNFVTPINTVIRDVSERYGWTYVGGVASDFRRHGYCADPTLGNPTGRSWVRKAPESEIVQGDLNGTGHPNHDGQRVYGWRILEKLVPVVPPRTEASATSGGAPYAFGTWTPQDVVMTLASTEVKLPPGRTGNPYTNSGPSKATYYAVDEPSCEGISVENCSLYTGPFTISESGMHAVTFFGENTSGTFEEPKVVEVWIDKEPPRMTCAADPPALWPPNHRMVAVNTSVEAVDDVSGPAPYVLISVTASEGNPAEDIQDFVTGEPDTMGWLRASRFGHGPGRQYTLTYESSDDFGNTGTCDIAVPVPHDQGRASR